MKELLEDLRADSLIWRGTIITIGTLLISIVYTAFMYHLLPPIIPLFNQLPWGEERLAEKVGIILPVGFTICAVIVNNVLATTLQKTLPLVGRLLVITSIILTILLMIFLLKTTLLIL
jgi:hypothetical protein